MGVIKILDELSSKQEPTQKVMYSTLLKSLNDHWDRGAIRIYTLTAGMSQLERLNSVGNVMKRKSKLKPTWHKTPTKHNNKFPSNTKHHTQNNQVIKVLRKRTTTPHEIKHYVKKKKLRVVTQTSSSSQHRFNV